MCRRHRRCGVHCTHMYIYIYTHIYTYLYIYIYSHTQCCPTGRCAPVRPVPVHVCAGNHANLRSTFIRTYLSQSWLTQARAANHMHFRARGVYKLQAVLFKTAWNRILRGHFALTMWLPQSLYSRYDNVFFEICTARHKHAHHVQLDLSTHNMVHTWAYDHRSHTSLKWPQSSLVTHGNLP